MELIEVLNKTGLHERSQSLWLLGVGTADVSDIAAKAGVKRPTSYLVLDELKERFGFPGACKNLFTAESGKLQAEMYKKQELYKRFCPTC